MCAVLGISSHSWCLITGMRAWCLGGVGGGIHMYTYTYIYTYIYIHIYIHGAWCRVRGGGLVARAFILLCMHLLICLYSWAVTQESVQSTHSCGGGGVLVPCLELRYLFICWYVYTCSAFTPKSAEHTPGSMCTYTYTYTDIHTYISTTLSVNMFIAMKKEKKTLREAFLNKQLSLRPFFFSLQWRRRKKFSMRPFSTNNSHRDISLAS